MWNQSYFGALGLAAAKWRLAALFANASIVEARRINRIALLTPFLSILVQTACLGVVYGELLGNSVGSYVPFLAVSLALWQGFSTFTTNVAVYNDTINRHMSFNPFSPYTIHLAGLFETMMLLAAKLAAAVLVIVCFQRSWPTGTALAGTALGFVALSGLLFFFGTTMAYLLDRFRLLRALMPQVIGLAFLVTPVLWRRDQLTHAKWIVDFNPLGHALEVIRRPLLDGTMPWVSLLVVIGLTGGFALVGPAVHRLNRDLVLFRWIS